MRRGTLCAVAAAAALLAVPGLANAATFNVVSNADLPDGSPGNGQCDAPGLLPGPCTLRAAVMEANALAGPDSINVPSNTYVLTRPPDGTPNDGADGDLDISQDVTITGAGASTTTVSAGGDNGIGERVFDLLFAANSTVTISGLTITGGRSTQDGGGISAERNLTLLDSVVTDNKTGSSGQGGGIVENGGRPNGVPITVTIRNSTISNNEAGFGGGVSENGGGTVELFDSRIVSNLATGDTQSYGGGVLEDGGGLVTIDRSDISDNVVEGYLGGGVAENGGGVPGIPNAVTITNSLISGNRVTDPAMDSSYARGGGIGEDGGAGVSVVNTTITGNTAQGALAQPANGGGIAETGGGGVSTLNTTITDNTTDGSGGNIFNDGGDPVTVQNSIVSGGAPQNCVSTAPASSPITSQGNNIDSGVTCGFTLTGDMSNTNPLLGPLADNGGPTRTRALLPGSPAIDAANGAACPGTDQRGVARPQLAGCDIGAFEFAPDVTPPDTAIVSGPTGLIRGRTATFTFSSPEPGVTFECSIDGGAFFACTSPFTTPRLRGGLHTFQVRARDAAGNVDPTPATFEFRIAMRLSDLPDPVLGRLVNVEPFGRVRWAPRRATLRGGASASQKGVRFRPLREARQIPVGSFLDTKRGRVNLESARNRRGASQLGRFSTGIFQVLQSRKIRARGLTELRLKGSSFGRCRTRRSGRSASAAQLSRRTIRRLRSNARGRFRTRGRNSSATVRGTIWDTIDRCDGTLTKVRRGRVAVRDFRRKKTVIVRAGKSYLARSRR
jgi:hypothetical protein